MPSWQSYFIHPILRFNVKRKLASTADPLAARAILGMAMPPPKGARFEPGGMGGLEGEWARGPGPVSGTLLFLHGGGYFACSPQTHRSITGAYAVRGFEVFSPAYRLAPEHPFPAAVDDGLAAYRAMLAAVPAERLAIGGDSAGGGLTLATLLAAKAAGLPMPACVLLFSPWTDLTVSGASVVANTRRDSMLYGPKLREGAEVYLQGADPANALASPLFGDLAGLPPMLIQVGEPEVLLDDSTRLATAARDAGVTVEISVWPNLPHVWHVSQVFLPEAREAMDQAAAFAKRYLARAAQAA